VITADDCPGASLRSRYVCQNQDSAGIDIPDLRRCKRSLESGPRTCRSTQDGLCPGGTWTVRLYHGGGLGSLAERLTSNPSMASVVATSPRPRSGIPAGTDTDSLGELGLSRDMGLAVFSEPTPAHGRSRAGDEGRPRPDRDCHGRCDRAACGGAAEQDDGSSPAGLGAPGGRDRPGTTGATEQVDAASLRARALRVASSRWPASATS
jgi:hypothetical protein